MNRALSVAAAAALLAACGSEPLRVDALQRARFGRKRWPTAAIELGSQVAARRYLLTGWSDTEQRGELNYRWASGREAGLRFVRRPAPTRIRLLGCSGDGQPVEAELAVNRHPVGKVGFQAEGSEALVDVAPELLAASGENTLTLRFLRDITVETVMRRNRPVFRPRNLGLARVTFGPPGAAAGELVRLERRSVQARDGGLGTRAGATVTTYWHLRKGSTLQLGIRNPPQELAATLEARVRILCRDRSTQWRQRLAPGESIEAELELELCPGQPAALQFETGPDHDPDLAAELHWAAATVTAPRARPKPAPAAPPPLPADTPVVLIVLDAAAAKHFHSYGYHRPTTPNLDRLAEEGTLFERAYAPAAFTLGSVGSILTGHYPESHGVIHPHLKLPPPAATLAEILRQAGYKTASLIGNHHAGATFGYHQGFEVQEVWRIRPRSKGQFVPASYDNYAENLLPAIERFVAGQRGQPLFLYLHFREPHSPYWPPQPYDRLFPTRYRGTISGERREMVALERGLLVNPAEVLEHLVALYDGNLAYVDAQVGRALEILRRHRLYQRSWIIVTADHGESFLEHGEMRHSSSVYEQNVHIPLLMKFPAAEPRGQARVRELASLVDLLPTVAAGLGLEVPATVQGTDLRTLVFHPGVSPRRTVLALTVPQYDGAALIGERYKLISMPLERRVELYDLRRDPNETDNLAARAPLRAGLMLQELRALRARHRALRPWSPGEAVIDSETREALRALGYVNG
ncbi:MAG TPA: sulfatase [Acidobacteriota bacterium]